MKFIALRTEQVKNNCVALFISFLLEAVVVLYALKELGSLPGKLLEIEGSNYRSRISIILSLLS